MGFHDVPHRDFCRFWRWAGYGNRATAPYRTSENWWRVSDRNRRTDCRV